MTTSLIIRASRTRLVDLEPIPLEAVEDDDLQTIPLVGTVSAGEPIDIYEVAEELEVPASWVSKNTFALRVRGDSMIDDHIQDGDVIIVEQRTYADNDETVVPRINGEQAALKKLYVEKDHIRLQPANSSGSAQSSPLLFSARLPTAGVVVDSETELGLVFQKFRNMILLDGLDRAVTGQIRALSSCR